jgi:hypothetical protein
VDNGVALPNGSVIDKLVANNLARVTNGIAALTLGFCQIPAWPLIDNTNPATE